jgi:hypothetical protein
MTINVPRVCGHTCAESATLPAECFCARRMRPVVKTQTAGVYGSKQ